MSHVVSKGSKLYSYIMRLVSQRPADYREYIKSCLVHCYDEDDVENSLWYLRKNCPRWFR